MCSWEKKLIIQENGDKHQNGVGILYDLRI